MSSSEIKRDLIIDVGLHKGEDTEYCLRKGFRVAAIEADPALARAARMRFSTEIKIGRLHIFEGAIAEGSGTTLFYQNEVSVWGSIFENWVERNKKNAALIARSLRCLFWILTLSSKSRASLIT